MFAKPDAYEGFMGRWSRLLAAPFIEFAGVRDGETILDVGSGTGVVSFAIAERFPNAKVVGIDPSEGFVEFAKARRGPASVRFELGSAEAPAFADGSFDRVVSMLVLNFVPDRARAMAELRRVTRPGGTIAAATWNFGPAGGHMLRVFWDAAIALDPSSDHRDERHLNLNKPGELGDLFRASGLADVQTADLAITTQFQTFEDFWNPFLLGIGPAGAYVAALSDSGREALRKELNRRLGDRDIRLTARSLAARGLVP